MADRPFKAQAETFLVWREGTAVNWDCSYVELSQATGLTIYTVRKICMARGWQIRGGEQRMRETNFENSHSLDVPDLAVMMSSPVDYSQIQF